MSDRAIAEAVPALVELSRRLGSDLLLTQGSGGNTSVKVDGQRMVIKASGYRLGEVALEKGWVPADFETFRAGAAALWKEPTQAARERGYKKLLASATLTPEARISLETGLHALLPDRWVAHAHSIAGQMLGLMPEPEALAWAGEILGPTVEVRLVPPAVPGFELSRAVALSLNAGPRSPAPVALWILQNHGLAWAGNDRETILSAIAAFEKTARARFGLAGYAPPRFDAVGDWPAGKSWHRVSLPDWPACDFDTQPVIGDFVGHFGWPPRILRQTDSRAVDILAASPRELEGHAQVFFAHALVSTLARERGWFRPLTADAVRTLNNFGLESVNGTY
jgi:ribulose-5-phosphate 4-epimerase/fuculose-1-phosphate aldolase